MSSYLFGNVYEVLLLTQTRLSSLQQPPHRNTFTQGGLKNVSVLLPSSPATSTHVSRGLHCVLCHSSSITAERQLVGPVEQRALTCPRVPGLHSTPSFSHVQRLVISPDGYLGSVL